MRNARTSEEFKISFIGTSLVTQWLRICLPMQGTWVQSLVQEDPTCHGGTKPVPHNYWDQALEPVSCSYGSPMPRTCAPQQEKPLRFLGKLHTGPHSGYKISISTKSVDSFFTPSPAFIVCRFFDGYHCDWCEVVLICISLIISHFEHLFICLLAGHMYTFFGKKSL